MTISTVEISPSVGVQPDNGSPSQKTACTWFESFPSICKGLLSLLLLGVFCSSTWAGALPGPWTPLFKGIDHAVGTNDPSIPGNFANLQVVNCVRVDLTDPDVRFFATPRASGFVLESRETLSLSVTNFLRQNHLQVVCDANYYNANPGGADPTSEGVPCDVFGLQISSGTQVSTQTTADAAGDPRYASVLITTNNQLSMVFANRPPGTNIAGIYTAVTGYYPVVSNGVNYGAASINAYPDSYIHQVQPRTAFGVSRDNRYLFLMTIDGRQPGYSVGALDTETGYWMLQFGAWNAISMDGGGSTAMYTSDSTGNPVPLSFSSYVAQYGRERYIGSHFGVFAKPLPGFINNVTALPDDTAATITWTTIAPATTLVQYGLTTNLGSSSLYSAALVTNHAALLTGLTPGTGYYYQVLSSDAGTTQYASSNFFFVTASDATTNLVFDFTNVWTYATADLDGVNWTVPGYDDSGWDGSGPGLLWVDNRGPNPLIPLLATQMSLNPATGYPFITYYLRTHFAYTNQLPGSSLVFGDLVDDGAVFYLNGAEIYRLRMAPAPTPIINSTLAAGYPCSGDATCPDSFVVSGDLLTNLVSGDNVMAAEVHNYNALSPDITFGISLAYTTPYFSKPQLAIEASNSTLTVSWTNGGFTLQQAGAPTGPWGDVPGPIVSSPFNATNSGTAQYFRLIK